MPVSAPEWLRNRTRVRSRTRKPRDPNAPPPRSSTYPGREKSRRTPLIPMTPEQRDMFDANTPLAYWVARHTAYAQTAALRSLGYPSEEIDQLALIGLMNATQKYDPEYVSPKTGKGVKFATYATTAIVMLFRREVELAGRRSQLEIPTDSRHWSDSFASQRDDVDVDAMSASEVMARLMMCLVGSQREVIELRFGLDGGGNRNQGETARILGISKQRVHQIEQAAMIRLRKAASQAGIKF